MPYSENFKRKMIQKLTGPDAVSATALSKQVDVSQTTLSKWLKKAGIVTSNVNLSNLAIMRPFMPSKRPEDWSPEEKLMITLEAASLSNEQLGAFLRRYMSSKLSPFFLYFVQSSAKFSHALRRVFEGPFSGMREFCYAVPDSTVHAASL